MRKIAWASIRAIEKLMFILMGIILVVIWLLIWPFFELVRHTVGRINESSKQNCEN
jgi:type II secretory pathway component PulM